MIKKNNNILLYIECVVNILFIALFSYSFWYYMQNAQGPTRAYYMNQIKGSNLIVYAVFIITIGIAICSLFFFFFHAVRLYLLKESKWILRRFLLILIWTVIFTLNVGLAYYIRSEHPKFLPEINGVSFTGYSFSVTNAIMVFCYITQTKNEITYFKTKLKSELSLVDELHETN